MQQRKTKIIATLGQSSCSKETIKDLLLAGMDVARISSRFISNTKRQSVLDNLHCAMSELGREIGVMLSLRESEIRFQTLDSSLELSKGDIVRIVFHDIHSHSTKVLKCNNRDLPDLVQPNDQLLIDFGKIIFTVIDVESYCKIRGTSSLTQVLADNVFTSDNSMVSTVHSSNDLNSGRTHARKPVREPKINK